MRFIFKAKNNQGEIKEGVIEASSQDMAASVIQRNGLFPVSIAPEKEKTSLEKSFLKYYDKVSTKELVVFFRQLAILIEARVPILVAIRAIKDQSGGKYFVKILEEVIGDVQDGMSFSDALQRKKEIFPNMAINIVKAGEASGNLKRSVEYVADNLEKNYNLVSKIKSSLTYPAVILIAFFIVAFLTMSFIIPKLTSMIQEINAEVPWYTTTIFNIAGFMNRFWWAVALVLVGFVGGLIYYINTNEGRREWDQIKLKIPVIGKIFQYVYLARFADNLAVLLLGGIPIIRALEIVSLVINNSVYESIFLKAADEVKVGGNMSNVLSKYREIPPIVTQMIKIGEDSGQIEEVLKHVSNFYEKETDLMTRNLAVLIEPFLIIIIGIGVGFLAFSVLMPIYNIAGQM